MISLQWAQLAPTCAHNLTVIKEVCTSLRIPLALEKVEGPSDCLTFLGIMLDTQLMQVRLPDDKLHRIKKQVASWLSRRKATKRDILSLVGLLQHVTKVVTPGRTFVSRMHGAAARLKKLSHVTRLTKDFHSNLRWWHLFVTCWNERSMFDCSLPHHRIFSDVSRRWGCGAVFGTQWIKLAWSREWTYKDIMAKELVPIVLSCVVWGPLLSGTRVEFRFDNSSVFDSINKGSSKEPTVMHLLRCLWFFSALFDINISASHIPGMFNTAADKISRNQSKAFLRSNPDAARTPVLMPTLLLKIISPRRLNWTSSSFVRHFKCTLNRLERISHCPLVLS